MRSLGFGGDTVAQHANGLDVAQEHLIRTHGGAGLREGREVVEVDDVGAGLAHRVENPAGLAADVEAHGGPERVKRQHAGGRLLGLLRERMSSESFSRTSGSRICCSRLLPAAQKTGRRNHLL